jgi:tetratricopeptide (TPR) repeat protein
VVPPRDQLQSYIRPHVFLGHVYMEQRRFPAAIATFKKAVSLRGNSTEGLDALARAYILSGSREMGLEVLRQLEHERHEFGRDVSSLDFAGAYVALGDRDKAFGLLEQAYAARSGRLASLKVDPEFRPLHSDPRFKDLIARIGL